MDPDHFNVIKSVYNAREVPGSYGGVNRLLSAVRKLNPAISRKHVVSFLEQEETYTLFKLQNHRFKRLRVRVKGNHRILSADLADFQRITEYNAGFNYLFVAIDIFSRKLYVVKLKTKTGAEVTRAMESVLKRIQYPLIWVDQGTEFYNRPMQRMLTKYGSKLYSTNSGMKAVIAERVIRTIKGKIYRIMHQRNSWQWVDIVDAVVAGYNDTKHMSFKSLYTPNEVDSGKVSRKTVHRILYPTPHDGHGSKTLVARPVYKTGDIVRLVQSKSTFARGFYQRNTTELFRVTKINARWEPVTYSLVDFDGESVAGVVYQNELVRASPPDSYPFDVLRKRVHRGKRQLYVRYRGWPAKFDSWIDESQAKTITNGKDR